MALLEVQHLQKIYTTRFGGNQVQALSNVNFSLEPGEYVAIMGESGSGKTTLLNILAALDEPTAGTVRLEGRELHKIREKDAALFRRENLGFVFQDFSLLDTFSLEDNICLPLVLAGKSRTEMRDRLAPLARGLGIEPLLKKYPYEVSGGQKQRAAIARAFAVKPEVLLMDEPTSALDPIATRKVEESIVELKEGLTIIIVTHSMQQAARISDRTAFFYMGRLVESDSTDVIFTRPSQKETEDYITGRFG